MSLDRAHLTNITTPTDWRLGHPTSTQKGHHSCKIFPAVKNATDSFVQWADEKLEEQREYLEVETTVPQKRVEKETVLPGEIAKDEKDEKLNSADKAYEVKFHPKKS